MMIIFLFFFLCSDGFAQDAKSHEEVVKEFHEPGHIPQGLPIMKYAPLEEVIPRKKQNEIKERKKKKHKAQEGGCVSPKVIQPSPIIVVTATPEPVVEPIIPPPQPEVTPVVVHPVPDTKPEPSPTKSVLPLPIPTPSVVMPILVDLRPFDSYIHNQWGNTCTAHAVSSGIENILNHSYRKNLSVRYLWSQYGILNSLAALTAASQNNQIGEEYWPEASPTPYVLPVTLPTLGKIRLMGYKALSDADTAGMRAEIDRGKPLYLALQVPSDLASCRATIRPNSPMTGGGHALLIVGYGLDSTVSGGGYFIVKNSWGTSCGSGGYHFFPFSFCSQTGLFEPYCDIYKFTGVSQ